MIHIKFIDEEMEGLQLGDQKNLNKKLDSLFEDEIFKQYF